jgi:hypothetical protein
VASKQSPGLYVRDRNKLGCDFPTGGELRYND